MAGWPSRRDAWAHNGRVIVSHGGGKSEVDAALGPNAAKKASLKQDQSSSDSTIRALLHSSRHRLPIVLIAAENYALLPFHLACSYAVLGWYLITDGWAERETSDDSAGFVRWKFRFEWIPSQGQPWWEFPGRHFNQSWNPRQRTETFTNAQRHLVHQMLVKEDKSTSPRLSSAESTLSSSATAATSARTRMNKEERHQLLFGPIKTTAKIVSKVVSTPHAETPCNLANAATCLACRFPSPVVFDLGWMCLQTECQRFFLLPSGQHPDQAALHFASSFLLPQGNSVNDAFPGGRPPFSLIPRRPDSDSLDQARGLWCHQCGRLSCRELIYQPRCAHCNHRIGKWEPLPIVAPPVLSRSPFDFTFSSDAMGPAIFDPIISPSSGIVMSVRKVNGLAMYTFAFPAMFGDCCVHLIQADVDGGASEAAADRIFSDFQKHAWPLDTADEKEVPQDTKCGKLEQLQSSPSTSALSDPTKSDAMHVLPQNAQDSTDIQGSSASTTAHDHKATEAPIQPPLEQRKIVPFRRHVLKSHAGGPGRMLTQQFTCNYGVPYKHVVAMGTEPLDATSPPVIRSTLDLLHTRTRSILPHSDGFNELYPVLYLEHQKMSFHDDGEPGLGPIVSSLSLGSTCRMRFRLKAKHQPEFAEVKHRDRVVLDLPLRHGSVVVQQGHDLQRYFEHCVNPDGFRIAVTARRIDAVVNEQGEKRPRRCSSSSRSPVKTNATPSLSATDNVTAVPDRPANDQAAAPSQAPKKPRARSSSSKRTGNSLKRKRPASAKVMSIRDMVQAAEDRFQQGKRKAEDAGASCSGTRAGKEDNIWDET